MTDRSNVDGRLPDNADALQPRAQVANLRRYGLHKLTTRLARECGIIVVEDLNVAVERRPADRGRPLVSLEQDNLAAIAREATTAGSDSAALGVGSHLWCD
jgi:hypothetical protein